MRPLVKQPAESDQFVIPFAGVLAAAAIIASVDGVVQAKAGRVPGALDLTLSEIEGVDQEVRLRIEGGTDGELYTLTATVTDDAGNVAERDVDLQVIDFGGYVPPETGGYLTPQEYVERFGFDETTQLTDLYGARRMDAKTLTHALGDADAVINGYIQHRFDLPFASVPRRSRPPSIRSCSRASSERVMRSDISLTSLKSWARVRRWRSARRRQSARYGAA